MPSENDMKCLRRDVLQMQANVAAAEHEHKKRAACIAQLRGNLQLHISACLGAINSLRRFSYAAASAVRQSVLHRVYDCSLPAHVSPTQDMQVWTATRL